MSSLKIVTIVGARPQFIKAAPVSAAIRKNHHEYLVHTGQHYDQNMSQLFFDELGIPAPDINLEIGSGPHGQQTAQMLTALERVLNEQQPDLVMVYGDTNSTLAGALAAGKMGIAIAHVEAGLRSFNRHMPEEVNRVLTDRISALLLCPTQGAVAHLQREGIRRGVHLTGDVMFDAALHFADLSQRKSDALQRLGLQPKSYVLATCHRPQNTDDPDAMAAIIAALNESQKPVMFPVHPRTVGYLKKFDLLPVIERRGRIRLVDPVGYLDMIQLEKNAAKIVTDSGGVQKEAYFYQVPCITMRAETEWVETVQDGWNVLVGADKDKILQALQNFHPDHEQARHYGDGHASERIAAVLQAGI